MASIAKPYESYEASYLGFRLHRVQLSKGIVGELHLSRQGPITFDVFVTTAEIMRRPDEKTEYKLNVRLSEAGTNQNQTINDTISLTHHTYDLSRKEIVRLIRVCYGKDRERLAHFIR